jgi:polysaccharide pyruvyl transferase WcaK-like protein
MSPRIIEDDYLLIYSRRYNPEIYDLAEKIANKNHLRIVEISLNMDYKENHLLMYSAGIEEFLSLIHYAGFIVTNSLHGTIFSMLMKKPFFVFPREHGDKKIDGLLRQFGLEDRKIGNSGSVSEEPIDYEHVYQVLNRKRKESYDFLQKAINLE